VVVTFAVILITNQRGLVMRIFKRVSGWFPERMQSFAAPRVEGGIASLDVLQSNIDILKIGLWSALIWGTAILNNHLTLLALDIHLPLTASILILIALQAGISIPSVPGRFGIFEYICVLALSVYGIDQATAFSYGILLHAIVMLPSTIVGLIFIVSSGLSREDITVRTSVTHSPAVNNPQKNKSSPNTVEGSEGN
jgi:uncharacterized membrane protein YbhN (UPF0104 family)